MSEVLENRYRRLLSFYPSSWRTQNGAAILGTLMDAAEAEGRDHPSTRDRVDLIGRGVAARVDAVVPGSVRDTVASVMLPLGFAFSVVYFFFHAWAPLDPARDLLRQTHHFGPFMNPGVVLCAVWFVAFALTILHRHRAARATLLLGLVMTVLTPGLRLVDPAWDAPALVNLLFLLVVGVLASAGTPTRLRRVCLASLGWTGGLVALYAANSELDSSGDRMFFWRIASPMNVGLVMPLVIALTLGLLIGRQYTSVMVLTLCTLPWLTTSIWRITFGQHVDGAGLILGSTVAVAVCGIAAIRLAHDSRAQDTRVPVTD